MIPTVIQFSLLNFVYIMYTFNAKCGKNLKFNETQNLMTDEFSQNIRRPKELYKITKMYFTYIFFCIYL